MARSQKRMSIARLIPGVVSNVLLSPVIFLGLNAVRVLSIIGLLLVFSSSILVMVTNIKAVNRFQANRIANSTDLMLDCDYIECVWRTSQKKSVSNRA